MCRNSCASQEDRKFGLHNRITEVVQTLLNQLRGIKYFRHNYLSLHFINETKSFVHIDWYRDQSSLYSLRRSIG